MEQLRDDMVSRQIAARGVRDQRVLDAMRAVPRECFVPQQQRGYSYEDTPLSIGFDQTISQPYIVAVMIEQLELTDRSRVLEVGSGSGYAAAVAARIAGEVYGVERHGQLARRSERTLAELGVGNVRIRHGNGYLGWPEQAPFDAILVSASCTEVPPALPQQLRIGGVLVLPVGESGMGGQQLLRISRTSETDFARRGLGMVSFVPLVNSIAGRRAP